MLCRICQEKCTPLFQKIQLNKYSVRYYKCQGCRSAQTEPPYWIEEAYHDLNYALDTGMVARTLFAARVILALAINKNFNTEDACLDIGGGTGLLTRMLRDRGLNAYWSDRFSKNIFAIGFEKPLDEMHQPKLLTAIEVFEHFVDPRHEVSKLLEAQPSFLLFSTKLYEGQDQNWWYFLADGQHVQFYSKQGLTILAREHDYHLQSIGSTYHLFSKKPEPPKFLKKIVKMAPKVEKRAQQKWPSRTEKDYQIFCY